MKIRNSIWKISFLCSIIYLLLGNLTGYLGSIKFLSDDNFLFLVFAPYSFVWGICSMEGWDLAGIIIQIVPLVLMTFIFLPIGLIFVKDETSNISNTNK